jgi:putative addiction module component (TIGR02574 family)
VIYCRQQRRRRQTVRASEIPQFADLSTPEKILLLEDLWDDIASDEAGVPVPQSHRDELDRRSKAHAANPGALLSLAELQARVERAKAERK